MLCKYLTQLRPGFLDNYLEFKLERDVNLTKKYNKSLKCVKVAFTLLHQYCIHLPPRNNT